MISVSTEFVTESGSKYLQQLCKHFAHKGEAVFTPEKGEVKFSTSSVSMEADAKALRITCNGNDEDGVAGMCNAVERHLKVFAFREPPQLSWQRDGKVDAALNARLAAMPDPHAPPAQKS